MLSSWVIRSGLIYILVHVAIVFPLSRSAIGTFDWNVIASVALLGILLPAVLSGLWAAKQIQTPLKPAEIIQCGAIIFTLSLCILVIGEVLSHGARDISALIIVLLLIWVPTALSQTAMFVGVLWITRCVALKEISLRHPDRRIMRAILLQTIIAAVLFYPAMWMTSTFGVLHDAELVGVLTVTLGVAGCVAARDYAQHHKDMPTPQDWALFALGHFGIASIVVWYYVSATGSLFGLIQGGALASLFYVIGYAAWIIPAVGGVYLALRWGFMRRKTS